MSLITHRVRDLPAPGVIPPSAEVRATAADARADRLARITEGFAYVGAAGVAAGVALLATWRIIPFDTSQTLLTLSLLTVLFIAVGAAIRDRHVATRRARAVMWALGTVTGVAFFGDILFEETSLSAPSVALFSGMFAVVLTLGLYAVRSYALQQIALFGAVNLLAYGALAQWTDMPRWGYAVTLFGLAAVFGILGRVRALVPVQASAAIAGLGTLGGAVILLSERASLGGLGDLLTITGGDYLTAALWVGIGTAVALVIASYLRGMTVMRPIGGLGMAAFLPALIVHYFSGEPIAAPIVVLSVAAAALVAGAALSYPTVLHRATHAVPRRELIRR